MFAARQTQSGLDPDRTAPEQATAKVDLEAQKIWFGGTALGVATDLNDTDSDFSRKAF